MEHIWIFVATLGLSLTAFGAFWPLSLRWRDASVVDFWWGPGFLAQAVLAVSLSDRAPSAVGWAILALITLWSLRLGWTLGRRRLAEGREDPRYTALRNAWAPGFWWKSLFLVFLLQGAIQWAAASGPVAAVLFAGAAPWPLTLGAGAIALGGLALEVRADWELDRFKRGAAPGTLCMGGLRAYLRYPNYLGEILFWAGVGAMGALGGVWVALIAPVLIALLLAKVSGAPMLEEHLSATRRDYAAYRAHVPAFLPRRTPYRPEMAAMPKDGRDASAQ